jgi:hypothetical protein
MMLKVIFFSFISIIGLGLIMYFTIFFQPNPETKIKINPHEISTKLSSNNQTILIPTGHKILSVYLFDDGFTSPHIEVNLQNKINISIFLSNSLNYEVGKEVRRTIIINNIKIREYQTKDKKVIYIFKVGKLSYLYEFHEIYRKNINEYISNNIP